MDQALIETSTVMACVIVASVFFAMGLWLGCWHGHSRALIHVWNKWDKLSAEEARRIAPAEGSEEMWQCMCCQHPNVMAEDRCGVCGLGSDFTGAPG